MKCRAALLIGLLLSSVPAFAQDHALAANIGMLGLGVEYGHGLTDRLALRVGLNGSSFGYDSTESGIDYAFDFDWSSLSVGVDFRPRRDGALRLSGGLLRNDNGLKASSRPTGNVMIGDGTYTPAEVGTLRGVVSFDSTAPWASVGWDWSRNKFFGVALDLGLLSQGSPHVSLAADGTLLGDPQFSSDLGVEASQLEDSLSSLDLVPFVTLGLVFHF